MRALGTQQAHSVSSFFEPFCGSGVQHQEQDQAYQWEQQQEEEKDGDPPAVAQRPAQPGDRNHAADEHSDSEDVEHRFVFDESREDEHSDVGKDYQYRKPLGCCQRLQGFRVVR